MVMAIFQWPVFCFSGTHISEFSGILKNILQFFVNRNPELHSSESNEVHDDKYNISTITYC